MTTGAFPDVFAFGTALVQTGDLDGYYLMAKGAGLEAEALERWCLTFVLFEDPVASCELAPLDGGRFWDAADGRIGGRRGPARRYFRGASAARALRHFRDRWPEPNAAFSELRGANRIGEVRTRLAEWPSFGPWAQYKTADLLDAVLDRPVSFEGDEANIYARPKATALGLAKEWWNGPLDTEAATLQRVFGRLRERLGALRAPHAPERVLGVQEYETILCKWGSHCHGSYPLGLDSIAYLRRLRACGDPVAGRLAEAGRTALDSSFWDASAPNPHQQALF